MAIESKKADEAHHPSHFKVHEGLRANGKAYGLIMAEMMSKVFGGQKKLTKEEAIQAKSDFLKLMIANAMKHLDNYGSLKALLESLQNSGIDFPGDVKSWINNMLVELDKFSPAKLEKYEEELAAEQQRLSANEVALDEDKAGLAKMEKDVKKVEKDYEKKIKDAEKYWKKKLKHCPKWLRWSEKIAEGAELGGLRTAEGTELAGLYSAIGGYEAKIHTLDKIGISGEKKKIKKYQGLVDGQKTIMNSVMHRAQDGGSSVGTEAGQGIKEYKSSMGDIHSTLKDLESLVKTFAKGDVHSDKS